MDILSNNTEIDHPLCDECCDTLINLLDTELRAAEDECNQYSKFLKKLESEPDSEDIEALEGQLKDLKLEEGALRKELNELKIVEASALDNLERQKKEQDRLREQEELFLKEYCRHKRQLSETEDQYQSLENELRYVEGQLERLDKTNALNATFHIWHSGHFGTINTFRLGRLPSEPVDWNEINAAWGQTALLLNSLARKINFKFSNYQLVPFGNHSYIKVLADNSELPLHGSGGFRLLGWDTKFDQGMSAFLDCLSQLQTAMLEKPGQTGFSLPYKMSEKGKIEDTTSGKSYSIKIQLNSEECWTKALKFMLTNLKWALAWVSSQTVQDEP
jgi:beclin 1